MSPDEPERLERQQQAAFDEGCLRGRQQSIIEVYEVRFGAVPAEFRSVIEATTDEGTLRIWLRIAAGGSAEAFAAAVRGARAG